MVNKPARLAAWFALICWLCVASAAFAQKIDFPTLSGRVVDNANLLDAATRAKLAAKLEQLEATQTIQLVVATLPDLQGYTIEEYGYQLGRQWGIGQQGEDNGLLLLVAPNQRKVRIDVGYGLEGVVTDAIASNIIQSRILPQFKQQSYASGIEAGVDALIEALGGEYISEKPPEKRGVKNVWLVFLMAAVIFLLFGGFGGGGSYGRRGGHYWGGGFGGGGGGFGGGGGGFGGGGASGGW